MASLKWISPRAITWVVLLLVGGTAVFLYTKAPSLEQQARSIQSDLAEIRGRSFKAPVTVRQRGRESNAAALETQWDRLPKSADYGKVVRTLGPYNGQLEKLYAEYPPASTEQILSGEVVCARGACASEMAGIRQRSAVRRVEIRPATHRSLRRPIGRLWKQKRAIALGDHE
jgi:hypothetical protein